VNGVSFRTVVFRRETASTIPNPILRRISRLSRLAHGLLSPSVVNEQRTPTTQEKEIRMIKKTALAIVVAGALMTTYAHAAPRGEDVQAPRGEDVQAPRGQDVQAPRAQTLLPR
jgi:hypothetical protein